MLVGGGDTGSLRRDKEGESEWKQMREEEELGLSGGIIVMWNPQFINFEMIGRDLHSIHGVVEVNNSNPFQFLISAIYASTKFKSRIESWHELIDMSKHISVPWVVMGDFNEITCQSDKLGGNRIKQYRADKFVDAMDECGLIDVGNIGSFSNMVNENMNAGCSNLVTKLKNISKTMSSWAKDNIGNFLKKGKILSARLRGIEKALEIRPNCRHLLELNEELSKELGLIYEQEETFWMAKARCNWIKSGDANTGFFHKSVIIRRRRNKISKLTSEVGLNVEGPDLVSHIVTYFTNLFTLEITIPPCEDHHYRNEINIDQPTSIEEIGKTVFELGPLKAPGRDGLHAYFYQQHWGSLWQDTYNFVDSILQDRSFPI
ncbi:uncharacterized protein [Spinacia oleracea]|uniref:Endonuclease/exonuclease/phosphatase domain-containing protein n=1 Tax=Spinacia oleracea TaxID=3562 RepID=A0A9R0JBE0_SPIOL|nr:uncharacterized protein LOC110803484 [Spinacia oleracea]